VDPGRFANLVIPLVAEDFDVGWHSGRLTPGHVRTFELSQALARNLTPPLEAWLAGTWNDQN
jgi:hypothetical protein